MKKIFWAIGVLLVVVVAAALIGPGMVDWNQYKSDIQAQARNATGRALIINGDISITVLPAPALIVQNVLLANIKGAASNNMVRLKSLEVRIALAPLLGGQVKVEQVKLVNPEIELEVLADGRRNWVFDTGGEKTATGNTASVPPPAGATPTPAPAPASGSMPAIALENVSIENGTVTYRDTKGGIFERVEAINATFAAASLAGPVESAGGLKLRGVPLNYDLNVGEIIHGRTVPFNLKLGMTPGALALQMNGTLVGIADTPKIKGKIKGEGTSLAAVIQALRPGTLPGALNQAFGIEATVTAGADGAEAKGFSARLGSTQANGDVSVTLGKTANVAVRMGANRIDMDKWLSLPETSDKAIGESETQALPSAATPVAGGAKGAAEPAISLPANINASLAFSAEAVTYRGGVIRNAQINAELANGEITLSQLSAQFPGGSDMAVFGFATVANGAPRFEGKLESTVNDLRGVLKWLGTDIQGVAPDRLRKMTLATRVVAVPESVQLTGLDLQFDSSRLTGGVTLALTRRLSFGADVTIDRLNLDAYLPKPGGTKKTEPQAAAASDQGKDQAEDKGKAVAKGAGPFAALKPLTLLDANLKARVNSLVYRGNPVKNAFFNGTLYNGKLDIGRLSIDQVAGAELSAAGSLDGLGGVPKASALTFKANAADVAKVLQFIGQPPPPALKGLGPVAVDGRIDGSLLAPIIKVNLTGAGATATLFGEVDGLAVIPTVKKMTIQLKAKDATRLLKLAGVGAVTAKQLGPVTVDGTIDGNLLTPAITLDLKAAGGSVAVSGKVNTLPIGDMADVSLNVRHPDLARLLRTIATGYRPSGKIGALDVQARLRGGPKEITLTGLTLKAGAASLSGDIVVGLSGPRPDIKANLNAGAIVIDPFMPAQKTAALWPGLKVIPVATHRGNSRWSSDPVDLSGLDGVDAQVAFKSPSLQFEKYKLTNADLSLRLGQGQISADKLTGVLFGGALQATAKATTTARPRIETVVAIENVNVGEATRAFTGESMASGKMGLQANLKTAGASVAAMISGLGGSGSVRLQGVDVQQGNAGGMMAGALGLVSALNQFGGTFGGANKPAGVVDLSGSFNISNGIANTQDMKIAASMGNGNAAGSIDLPRWLIDVKGQVQLSQNFLTALISKQTRRDATQSVPFTVRGRLDKPNINLDTSKLTGGGLPIPGADKLLKKLPKGVGGILQGILGGGAPQPQTEGSTGTGNEPPPPQPQQQQQQQKVNPADLLRDLFKRR
ncbi:MAG: AsmA family protein [Proteobacteria bacterium]|nr:AsmA family protein [Pseudomonadota bacterium]